MLKRDSSTHSGVLEHLLEKITIKLLSILSTLAIALGSIMPIPSSGGEETRALTFNLLHFTSYIVCSFLWAHSIKSRRVYIALMVLITPLTEILQLPLLYRSSNIADLMINMMGVIIGYFIYGLSNIIKHTIDGARS